VNIKAYLDHAIVDEEFDNCSLHGTELNSDSEEEGGHQTISGHFSHGRMMSMGQHGSHSYDEETFGHIDQRYTEVCTVCLCTRSCSLL